MVDLRRATQADVPALTAIIDAAYRPHIRLGLPPVSEGLDQDIATHSVWVAEIETSPVGVVVVALDDTAQVVNLAVSPDAGGKGVGRDLLATAADLAREAGHARLHLATHVEMTGTQAFYRRLGWQETGRDGQKVYLSLEL